MWAPTLAAPTPFSPISPRLILMDPFRNKFWSQSQTPPPSPVDEIFSTSQTTICRTILREIVADSEPYGTPVLQTQHSNCSSELFATPDSSVDDDGLFLKSNDVRKMSTITEHFESTIVVKSESSRLIEPPAAATEGVLRSKSDFEIPKKALAQKPDGFLQNIAQKSDSLFQNIGFLMPLAKRRTQSVGSSKAEIGRQSTPVKASPTEGGFKLPGSPILRNHPRSQANGQRAISLNSLKSSHIGAEQLPIINIQQLRFVADLTIIACCKPLLTFR